MLRSTQNKRFTGRVRKRDFGISLRADHLALTLPMKNTRISLSPLGRFKPFPTFPMETDHD